MNDEKIIEKYIHISKTGHLILYKREIEKMSDEEHEYLGKRYTDSSCIEETLKRMYLKIDVHPICSVCGKLVPFTGNQNHLFREYCSRGCTARSERTKEKSLQTQVKRYGSRYVNSNKYKNDYKSFIFDKFKKTNKERYGVEFPQQNKEIHDKTIHTCLERYGLTNGGGSDIALENIQKTNISKYGVLWTFLDNSIQHKRRMSMLEKYGTEVPLKNTEIKEKAISTTKSKYGVSNVFQLKKNKEKREKICISRYGVSYPLQRKTIFQKTKNTIREKYGTESYFGSEDHLSKIQDIQEKIYEKKRNNHTFNTSKPEEELYLYIKEKFPLVKRQYKDKIRYPYNCDFYIPDLDYFIELQGYYTHGKEPYDPNSINHRVLLERYKEKYGENCQMINIWTIKDVEKRNCAKEHNLNFKEVWSLQEGKEFIDEIYSNNDLYYK